ncbi:phosphodiester glycosidase family protein [Rossellomorea sp. YZS02]|uniref:phosphodiester glycosidase family protein n=1 Tax=Rossellomorea sp. YZS02 TaxID=3097358 RepID=UPI002A115C65|nr:phosphodiester glycosidase family protein [Rossellomorea sp. YZS02]MDX8343184.1 S-layer homology domain-containing protein [Rossellomorea sp. YZS02]
MFSKHKLITSFVVLLLFLQLFSTSSALAATNIVEQFKASSGIWYKDTRITSTSDQAIKSLEMNLSDPYTKVEVGVPNPLNQLSRTTSQAIAHTTEQHQVVGAVNGSFFNQDRLPMYLISYHNKLVNAGIIATGEDQYVNEPIAFGIDNQGKGKIGHYKLDLSFVHNGKNYSITSTNKERSYDNLILYTPDFPSEYTNTNPYGMEVVVSNLNSKLDLEFGSTLTGTVQSIRRHGDSTNTKIPSDGFVLSAHGDSLEALKYMKIGDPINLSVNIDSEWKNSDFMLAGGPLLVKDGQVSLSMDPDSPRARERAPRTAVAIDRTGGKVYFVTVDGRQSGYSTGMSLTEFAQHLKSMGIDEALNIDGGGSTTMATRFPGDFQVKLANRPSDGFERSVSTTLMAVSTAPKGMPTYIYAGKSAEGVLLKGASVKVNLDYVLDQYYNPVQINPSNVNVVDSQGLGNVNGLTFTAAKAGEGSLSVQYGIASKNLPIKVVDEIGKLTVSPNNVKTMSGQKIQLKASGWDTANAPVIMNNSSIHWSVSGDIGTIDSKGLFTAKDGVASGTIIASYGSTKVNIPVTIGDEVLEVDSFDTTDKWSTSNVKASSSISNLNTPKYEGSQSLKWNYQFSKTEPGTSAAYLDAKSPIGLSGTPAQIGLRLFGDGKLQWVRGKVVDGDGNEHTINFTEEKGLSWNGWKYINASLDSSWKAPLKLKQIYIAQPYEELKTSGTIYLDQLQAVYKDGHVEPLFKDTGLNYWAETEVDYLINQGIISGFPDGKFQPNTSLNRVQAAILLARALKLDTNSAQNPNFTDVTKSYGYYGEIAAVANAGIMQGKEGGTIFDPYAKLTRAEMAVILKRAYKLPNATENPFKDNYTTSFAFEAVKALAEANVTNGYSDGTFRPANPISRTEFSVFLYRTIK